MKTVLAMPNTVFQEHVAYLKWRAAQAEKAAEKARAAAKK